MKSLRGSDPDAALHYLARFLEAGDLITPCRRLLCSASEDQRPVLRLGRLGEQLHRVHGLAHVAAAGLGDVVRQALLPARPGPTSAGAGQAPSPGSCRTSKSIRPDTRKIKLQVIQNLGPAETAPALKYFITDGTVENWRY